MKKIFVLLIIWIFQTNALALIEVDITRGNLNPLPIAVSPLSIDDKSKEETAETFKKNKKLTQSSVKTSFTNALTLNQEDALKAQIFGCWSIPLGLPYNEDLLVRIKLMLEPDGSVSKTEILDHARMNKPGQSFYKVLAESALRAVKLCQPLRVPTTGYERWKELQLNFDARDMLEG